MQSFVVKHEVRPFEEATFTAKSSLKLMPKLVMQHSITVENVDGCCHMSCITPNRIWISDRNNLLLLNSDCAILQHRSDQSLSTGSHTTTNENDLIYIDNKYSINKISKDLKTTSFLEVIDSLWKPRCVYWSLYNRDLLIGMYKEHPKNGKVAKFNQAGQLTQTIQHRKDGQEMYLEPIYIVENNNRDVVVSDYTLPFGVVVVSDHEGTHRFSYTGHPPKSGFEPRAICTDGLSNILVCDNLSKKVHMININGNFLLHLLTASDEIPSPYSLSYDFSTHNLWVGSVSEASSKHNVFVYKYITHKNVIQGHAVK